MCISTGFLNIKLSDLSPIDSKYYLGHAEYMPVWQGGVLCLSIG